jgi:MoaA/NifB/PqqE/SkfB family radical SAM enzyme
MNSYARQYDEDHKVQRLYVQWDLTTMCQLRCSYCYARAGYEGAWMEHPPWERQVAVVRALSRSSLPVFLGLLGGEPTIHPQYLRVLDMLRGAVTERHEDGRVYVTTNGLRGTEFFRRHPAYDGLYMLWSLHPEHEERFQGYEGFFDSVRIMRDKGLKTKVNLMLHPSPRYWDVVHRAADRLEGIEGIEVHPHFLYVGDDFHRLAPYDERFFEEFSRFERYPGYFVYEREDGARDVLNDHQVFSRGLTRFRGWDCHNNNHEVSVSGHVQQLCFDDGVVDLARDCGYFERIERVVARECPHDRCNCDGLLKCLKINRNKTGEGA